MTPPPPQLPPWERPQWRDGTDPGAADGLPPGPSPLGQQYWTPQYGPPHPGQPPYGQQAYGPQYWTPPSTAPPPGRSDRTVLLWFLGVAVALVAVVVGVLLVAEDASPDAVVPAPVAVREPAGLGEDPGLDRLAQECHDGRMRACDDLYTDSPVGSDYEDYGDTCAGRRGGGAWSFCADVFSDTGD
ncbi:hypothetical protein [Modestobacter versicolor]|uniref:hypothetical protein n=1 Tax=Modestobacter versicolor TaxID=429133 RepID=UPI0034DE9EB8